MGFHLFVTGGTMLQMQPIPAALVPGSEPWIWVGSTFFMIFGAGFLVYISRQAAAGVIRVWWRQRRGDYTDFRRDDDPYLFWGHVICMAVFSGLFFFLGLVGIIWSFLHQHGLA
jgi:hypothetical protein